MCSRLPFYKNATVNAGANYQGSSKRPYLTELLESIDRKSLPGIYLHLPATLEVFSRWNGNWWWEKGEQKKALYKGNYQLDINLFPFLWPIWRSQIMIHYVIVLAGWGDGILYDCTKRMMIDFNIILYYHIHFNTLISIMFHCIFTICPIVCVFQNSKNIPPKAAQPSVSARKQRPWLQRPLVRVAEVELVSASNWKPNPPTKSWMFDGFFVRSWWGENMMNRFWWWGNLMKGIKPKDFGWI